MALGSLVVRLGLDAAEFTSGLTKSEAQAKRFSKQMDSSFASAARFIGGLGIGAAVGLFIKDTISAASALDDLSDATGSSVENLSKLANQAKISGTDFATLEKLVLKLGLGISGVDDESADASKALKFLGVTATDPAEALQQVAVSLDKYADGVGKIALAKALFGKEGPKYIALLKDISQLQDVAATTSAQQAAEAEKLEKAIRQLRVESVELQKFILNSLVPTLNDLLEQFRTGRELAGGFWAAVFRLGTINPFKSTQENLKDLTDKLEKYQKMVASGVAPSAASAFIGGAGGIDKIRAQREFELLRQRQEIMSNVAGMGYTGDVRDYLATKKPSAGFTVTPDKKAKTGVDEFARALETARKMAAGAKAELDSLADGAEKLTHAQKALAVLQADDVWKKFTAEQRKQITAIYESAGAFEKETDAVNKRREAYEKHVQALQDAAAAEAKAREAVRQSGDAYALHNDVLARQIAIIGQNQLAHEKLTAAIEHERLVKAAKDATDIGEVARLNTLYQARLKLLDAQDAAIKQQEELQKSKQFVDALGEAFASAAEDAIVFGRSAKDVLKGLEQDLLRIITRRLVTQPLEAGINSLLTGMGVGNVGAGGTAAGANWGTTLANLASSYFGDSTQGGTYGYASGTNYARGGWAMVGERGPEAMFIPRGAQVVPNHELTRRREEKAVTTINVNVLPGATKQSVAQAADEQTRRQLQAARNR